MSHRQGNTKAFDNRWRKAREKAKAARKARKKQRGFFNISTGEWYAFLACVGVVGYAIIRGVEWLLAHVSLHWAVHG